MMPVNITQKNLQLFLSKLEELGGSCGNKSLRQNLDWDEEYYWKVQGKLVADGYILPGRGKGGSVSIAYSDGKGECVLEDEADNIRFRERDLYKPCKETISSTWINKFGYDSWHVEETHSQGSRSTGGTYTRPDITAAGIKQYIYLPRRLEITTFEIKSAENISIMGVLEAISHREAAHRAYTIYGVSREKFSTNSEVDRISDLSQRYGIGIILVEDPSNVETWDIFLDAIRNEPDPGRLDRFIGDLPSEAMKKLISKWQR